MPGMQLTPCELEVMSVVWRHEQVTVQDVVDGLDRSLAYTTVMTMMRILEDKQVIERRGKQSRAYVYAARVSEDEVRRSMAGHLRQMLFGGSLNKMLLSLVDPKSATAEDATALRDAIRRLEERT